MPKTFDDYGVSILFPDNWTSDEDQESQAVTIESPEGAFLSVTRFEGDDLQSPLEEAKQTMQQEYEEVEEEPFDRKIGDFQFEGVTQRFVYLDLIVTSHLIAFQHNGANYLVQIQAEDGDMTKHSQVFDAMLLSIRQN